LFLAAIRFSISQSKTAAITMTTSWHLRLIYCQSSCFYHSVARSGLHTMYIYIYIYIERERERERELFSKLDLPLFRGPFLSILQHNKARVGGWDFHSTQICFFKQVIVFIIVTMLVLFKFCITWNNLQRFAFSGMNTYPYHHACFNLNQIISTHTENLSVWYK
jgi:hypothetical protein